MYRTLGQYVALRGASLDIEYGEVVVEEYTLNLGSWFQGDLYHLSLAVGVGCEIYNS